jgi:hypothetical protein
MVLITERPDGMGQFVSEDLCIAFLLAQSLESNEAVWAWSSLADQRLINDRKTEADHCDVLMSVRAGFLDYEFPCFAITESPGRRELHMNYIPAGFDRPPQAV